jgi:cobalamin biosynthesis protein CobW
MCRVPATVITGFLGVGKTSLIRHLLACAEGRRLAVVVNEFGELGIDRASPPEHILIETSGVALPKPLVQAFARPEIRTRTTGRRGTGGDRQCRRRRRALARLPTSSKSR